MWLIFCFFFLPPLYIIIIIMTNITRISQDLVENKTPPPSGLSIETEIFLMCVPFILLVIVVCTYMCRYKIKSTLESINSPCCCTKGGNKVSSDKIKSTLESINSPRCCCTKGRNKVSMIWTKVKAIRKTKSSGNHHPTETFFLEKMGT